MHPTFLQQAALSDPRARLIAALERLDSHMAAAKRRRSRWGGEVGEDPDTHGIAKLEELGKEYLREYWSQTLSSVDSIATLDRQQAIAELKAVLEAWEDPNVTDGQWLASRRPVETPEVKPRPTVIRRVKAVSG